VFEWERFKEIADEVGALLVADISHIAGLIVAGEHPTPVGIADVIMTTTHKTLRGPRGAIIMTKSEEIAQKIDKAVFPGLQGGPHDNNTLAIAVALKEASSPEFKGYGKQVVKNAKALAGALKEQRLRLVSDGTDNHMLLIDFGDQGPSGKEVQDALETAGLIVNRNTVPRETRKPFVTSGIRLGTTAITTRGFKDTQMFEIAGLIARVVNNLQDETLLEEIATKVRSLTSKFPVP
jgi:glycine hydroxymethyltransferase